MRASTVALAVGALLGCTGGVETLSDCQPEDNVTPICGFMNPEDMASLSGGSWLLVSQQGHAGGSAGSLLGFRVADQSRRRLFPPRGGAEVAIPSVAWGSADCPGPPEPRLFQPHGVDVRELSDGRSVVAAINHGGRDSIELFELDRDARGPTLGWRGCVVVPAGVWPNDVVLLRDGGLITSHMLPMDESLETMWVGLWLMLGGESGALFEWDAADGWLEVAGSAGSAPNGVVLSPDDDEVYFSEWGADRLVRLERSGGDGPPRRESVDLPHHPDNISWTRDGQLLVAGQIGRIGEVIGCSQILEGTCSLDYSVVRVDPMNLTAEVVLETRGAGSVALHVGDDVYIGTFAGDRIARADYVR